jgi:hypothetical protein
MWACAVAVLGVLSCPTTAQINAELAHTRGASPAPAGESIRVRVTESELTIELETPRHHASRTVPRPESCQEAARLAATLVVAWETELEVTPLSHTTSLAMPPLDAPATTSSAAPSTTSSVAPSTTSSVAPSTSTTVAFRHSPPPIDYDVTASFVASLANTDFAAGGLADARLAKKGFGLGGYFGFLGEGTRTVGLGPDRNARWTRAALRFGASWRFLAGHFAFDLTAGGALALFYAQGAHFTSSLRVFDADFALGTGLRVGVRSGRLRPFVGIDVSGWLNKQRLVSTDSTPATADVPQLETLFTVGLALTN